MPQFLCKGASLFLCEKVFPTRLKLQLVFKFLKEYSSVVILVTVILVAVVVVGD
jgi:hypothetical protein